MRGVSDGACDTTFLMGEAGKGTRAATLGEGGTGPDDELGRFEGDKSLGKGGGGMLGAARTVRRVEFSSPLGADCLVGDWGSGTVVWLRVFMAASFMTFSPGALRERGRTVPKSQRSSSSEVRGGEASRTSSSSSSRPP